MGHLIDSCHAQEQAQQSMDQIRKIHHTNVKFNVDTIRCRANLQFITNLAIKDKIFTCIVDAGADTHLFGQAWVALFEETANTPRADVVGFDEKVARKHGLPMGPHATKIQDTNGRWIIIRATHGVSNKTSPHTLLCTYEMRDIGIIVDDVSKSHPRSNNGDKGTQSIEFKDGTVVNLLCKSALMTFNISKPTYHEVLGVNHLPIYDISPQYWDPGSHFDDTYALHNEPIRRKRRKD